MTPYAVLGLPQDASKDQVKDAFRKLVWQCHPDKASPDQRVAAEARFKEVKLAYEAILHREAGYRPPPPGSHPNVHNAEAYWHAHSADGRVPWGQFAGHETEWAFYKAMMKGGRNNMALLTVVGLLAIPTLAAGIAMMQSLQSDDWQDMHEAGLDSLRPEGFHVNGQVTQHNPWANNNLRDTSRWREAQARLKVQRNAAAATAEHGAAAAAAAEISRR